MYFLCNNSHLLCFLEYTTAVCSGLVKRLDGVSGIIIMYRGIEAIQGRNQKGS